MGKEANGGTAMTARLAMVADTVASVRGESRIWVRNLIGEGPVTVRRNRQAAEEELAATDAFARGPDTAVILDPGASPPGSKRF
jgi:hypothetical protein